MGSAEVSLAISNHQPHYRTRRRSQGGAMHFIPIMPMVLAGLVVGAPLASAEVLNTHRIPALLALEAASESVGVCAKQGYLDSTRDCALCPRNVLTPSQKQHHHYQDGQREVS